LAFMVIDDEAIGGKKDGQFGTGTKVQQLSA
jgi:hypothetical protein